MNLHEMQIVSQRYTEFRNRVKEKAKEYPTIDSRNAFFDAVEWMMSECEITLKQKPVIVKTS
jgi:hypothetical protein